LSQNEAFYNVSLKSELNGFQNSIYKRIQYKVIDHATCLCFSCRYDHPGRRRTDFRRPSERMEDNSDALWRTGQSHSDRAHSGSYSSLRGSLFLLLQMRGALWCSKPALRQKARSLQEDYAQHRIDLCRHYYSVSSNFFFRGG